MEYVDGGTLLDHVNRLGRLEEDEARYSAILIRNLLLSASDGQALSTSHVIWVGCPSITLLFFVIMGTFPFLFPCVWCSLTLKCCNETQWACWQHRWYFQQMIIALDYLHRKVRFQTPLQPLTLH